MPDEVYNPADDDDVTGQDHAVEPGEESDDTDTPDDGGTDDESTATATATATADAGDDGGGSDG
jgi:hypothetical protein